MKNIMVALDFEEKTINLLQNAIELATRFEAKVWLIHIEEIEDNYIPSPDTFQFAVQYLNMRDSKEKQMQEEHKAVQKYVDMLIEKGIKAEGLLIQGPTSKAILQEAELLKIDLIIMGSHKHSFLYNAIIKDPSVSLIEKSNIPMLVIPL